MTMRVVVALGGNALLRRGEPPTEDAQWRNVQIAAEAVAAIASRHETVVTHGNGPQVGLLALEAEAYKEVPPYGLDILGAESQGMIGFMLENALRNKLPNVPVATLLTSVVIDATDSALSRPTKPVGPVYDEAVARRLASDRGWTLAPDGEFFRRVVPSPLPQEILQLPAISALILAGIMVICAGGGGVPVRRGANGKFAGVEGVVDKDMTAALLAESLRAQWLLLLTDVPAVLADWGTPNARPISRSSPSDLRALDFAAGSMGPKVAAACRFVERTGGTAAIGALSDAASLLTGEAGTIIADL
jgi:carbamate kinase